MRPYYGVLRKGQALIWAANILHGGSVWNDKTLPRHSQVTHYYFDGCKYWRPSRSSDERFYFKPKWIPYRESVNWVSNVAEWINGIRNRILTS